VSATESALGASASLAATFLATCRSSSLGLPCRHEGAPERQVSGCSVARGLPAFDDAVVWDYWQELSDAPGGGLGVTPGRGLWHSSGPGWLWAKTVES
jgi:hypothetical protein